jgi:hypothetical protein
MHAGDVHRKAGRDCFALKSAKFGAYCRHRRASSAVAREDCWQRRKLPVAPALENLGKRCRPRANRDLLRLALGGFEHRTLRNVSLKLPSRGRLHVFSYSSIIRDCARRYAREERRASDAESCRRSGARACDDRRLRSRCRWTLRGCRR